MADDDSTTSDESLDAKSEKFDPMKALYSTKVPLSKKKAPLYDNISKFEAVISGLSGQSKKKSTTSNVEQGESSRRRFLPHQEPVTGTRYGRACILDGRNVLAKMQNYLGPLGLLYEYMENRTRVKVYTRNAVGIRGHVEAYVAAFDKHWNLALEDCFEVWTRKVKRKAPALGAPSATTKDESWAGKVVVTKIEGKRETLERHVPQMLLRGEQVAIIVKIN
ncbi:PREDICTED: U7 snRNA-associated Sm-like protein LSm11 [Dufourea novaeangliae]|uniref:U7 snRNA-associated Sm-like protein LSm11 n=1 Tax=Dufourea novaeangliae TaxID=178035 RepID=A0A154P8W1_DUFNO|nr:PREDICTED: U7 snRNA-associated Sm-like protein LSm11 [Dufourea novaeangliae]KZC07804.1 U7 snRNA-associated Sm-like protein LSm11 [Dufourea novaeangliae]